MPPNARFAQRLLLMALGCIVVFSPSALRSQQPSEHRLVKPSVSLESTLSRIGQVREIANGALLLLDPLEGVLYRADSSFRSLTRSGNSGNGPGEYAEPLQLIALPLGRSLVVHSSGSRGAIFDATGRPDGEWVPALRRSDCQSARPLLGVRFVDRGNRTYSEAAPVRALPDGRRVVADSAAIERWRSPCFRDTVALVESADAIRFRGGMMIGQSMVGRPGSVTPPFQASAQWAVFEDGEIAIVSPSPFSITRLGADGSRRLTRLPDQRVEVGEGHKRAWREHMQRPQVYVTARIGGEGQRGVGRPPAPAEPAEWPKYLPPFLADALHTHVNGELWIQRTTRETSAATYDVVGRNGSIAHRIILAARSRVVGLGIRHAYVVRTDDDEIEYLERFEIPWMTTEVR